MKTILLARHGTHAEVGRVLSGRSEIGLDPRGQAEVTALATRLAAAPLAAIHSSPRRRTRQTAAAVAGRTGLPVRIAPELDEVDFGEFAGRSFAALAGDPAWAHWNAVRDEARCPGGETMGEAIDRALGFLDALPEADAPILCVTHCDIIRGIVARLQGWPFARMFALDCAPASLTVLGGDGGPLRPLAIEDALGIEAVR